MLHQWIKDKWDNFNWVKQKNAPFGDSKYIQSLPEIEFGETKKKTISTTVDCYVTGTYITNKGKIFTIRQRYSIDVEYSRDDMREVMTRLREKIMSQFSQDHPEYSINDVFIPALEMPMNYPDPAQFYKGGKLYKYLTRYQEGKYILQTEKEIYKSVASKIIHRYGLRKKDAYVKRL